MKYPELGRVFFASIRGFENLTCPLRILEIKDSAGNSSLGHVAKFFRARAGASRDGRPGTRGGGLRAVAGAAQIRRRGSGRMAGVRRLLERRRQSPDHSPRRGSPGLDHRPERDDAAGGAGAPRRRIPLGGDRARRQRNGSDGPQRLDGRARRPGVQRVEGRGHRREEPHHRDDPGRHGPVCRRDRHL